MAPLGAMINVVKGRLGMWYRRPWRSAREGCHELRDLEAYDMLIGLQESRGKGERRGMEENDEENRSHLQHMREKWSDAEGEKR